MATRGVYVCNIWKYRGRWSIRIQRFRKLNKLNFQHYAHNVYIKVTELFTLWFSLLVIVGIVIMSKILLTYILLR